MRGPLILHQEEEQKALLRETHKFFTKFHCPVSDHQIEGESEEPNDSDHTNIIVCQFLGVDDDENEPTLQQDSIERTIYWESQEALLQV